MQGIDSGVPKIIFADSHCFRGFTIGFSNLDAPSSSGYIVSKRADSQSWALFKQYVF